MYMTISEQVIFFLEGKFCMVVSSNKLNCAICILKLPDINECSIPLGTRNGKELRKNYVKNNLTKFLSTEEIFELLL